MKQRILLPALLSLFASLPTFANEVINKQIQQFIDNGEVQKAYQFAQKNYAQTQSLEELFILAQLAKDNGRLMEAQQYYKKMLAIDPTLTRVKLELADVNVRLGNANQAQLLLTEINSQNLPQNVKTNVKRYLDAIENGEVPKNSALSISLQSIYDTNVNSGPSVDTVTMFGLPFKLSEDAKESSDLGYTFNANYLHTYRLSDDTTINSTLNLGYIGWSEFDDLNNLTLSAKTGIAQKLGFKSSLYLPIEVNKSIVDSDNYYTSYSLSPSFTHKLNDKAYVSLTGVVSKRDYDQNDKEVDVYSGNARFGYKFSPTLSTNLQLTYGTEDYNLDAEDNDFYSANATLSKSLNPQTTGYIGFGYSNVSYDNKSVAYKKIREDDNYSVRGGISYAVARNTNLIFDVSHNNNDSNIDMNEYDRTRVSIGVNSNF